MKGWTKETLESDFEQKEIYMKKMELQEKEIMDIEKEIKVDIAEFMKELEKNVEEYGDFMTMKEKMENRHYKMKLLEQRKKLEKDVEKRKNNIKKNFWHVKKMKRCLQDVKLCFDFAKMMEKD